jgi:DNA-binding NarL/FixJ family response regulator
VLLADDHTLILEGFRKILESHCEVVGTAEDGRALLAAAQKFQPDIIVLDISMPLLNGIDAARQLKTTLSETKLIFLTMHADPAYVTEAFRAGASGYVLKRGSVSELTHAIQEALKGRSYVTSLVTKDVLESVLEAPRGHPPKKIPGHPDPSSTGSPSACRGRVFHERNCRPAQYFDQNR